MSTSKDQTTAIYNNYRAALRAQPHTVASRAGARKQKALQITADRYHVPISEVKEIVRSLEGESKNDREQDFQKNLDHLKYLGNREAAAEVAAEKLLSDQLEITGDPDHAPICTTCGTSDEKDLVRIRVNEIHEAKTGELDFTLQCFKDWLYTVANRPELNRK